MADLGSVLEGKAGSRTVSKPAIFNLAKPQDQRAVSDLLKNGEIQHVVDDYREQQHELFQIKNPTLVYAPNFSEEFEKYLNNLKARRPLWQHGRWVYFPWISTIVHILDEADFQKVRTARNRNLITNEEQKQYYDAVVGIAGLSVGNSVALSLVLQGGARRIRLADHDSLALSNMNRIRSSVEYLGLRKVEMAARQIYLMNPYSEIELFPDGLSKENIDRFFAGPPKLDVIADEVDNIAIKYLIREQARKHKVPIVMGADNGDNAIIDIERHDLDPATPFFHGALGDVTYDELTKLDKFGIGKTITKMLGPENVTIRMQQSLLEMGKTIVSWPQLGGAALLNGIALAYCIRKIVNKQPVVAPRALPSLDEKFDPTYNSPEEIKKRTDASSAFKKIFGL